MIDKTLFNHAHEVYGEGEYEKAFELFLAAAKAGDVDCMSQLAVMYESGEGVEFDLDQSVFWDTKAIESGNVTSMHNLAVTYRRHGDIVKAKYWFEKAIESGDGEAALELAKLYMVSDKETETVRQYLTMSVESNNICEESREEARDLLEEMVSKQDQLGSKGQSH